MPIEALEPLVSVLVANIAWVTVFVYVAAVAVKAYGYDQRVFVGYSIMELAVIGVSVAFLYFVISPQTGVENVLSQITGWVVAITVLKPLVLKAVLD